MNDASKFIICNFNFSDHTNVEEISNDYNEVDDKKRNKPKKRKGSKSSSPTLNTQTPKKTKATRPKAVTNANNVDEAALMKNTVGNAAVNNDTNNSDISKLLKESRKFEAKESMKTYLRLEDCVEIPMDIAQTAVSCVFIPATAQNTASLGENSEETQTIDMDENVADEDIAQLLPEWLEDEIKDLDKYR